jgi:8-oxo-dGTP pyrophosphatase MutT (NUDIX family)
MPAGAILPVSINKKGQLVFLFGKENSLEDSSRGWSDFGGGCEGTETPFQTALREGGEELTFFLGDAGNIEKLIRKTGGFHQIVEGDYYSHLFFLDYDERLPEYYNANHRGLWAKMDKGVLNASKLFEKIEIAWFTCAEMKRRIHEFRGFYRDRVRNILSEVPVILKKWRKKHNKTIKRK